ncbi:MAG: hypothetical protein WCR59_09795 [Planctomycetota bacterium]|jgi:hypothetical protein
MHFILLTFAAMATACSTLPERSWPDYEECHILAEYAVQLGQPIALPISGENLTIFTCEISPAAAEEHFTSGQRIVVMPPHVTALKVRCHYRAYGIHGAKPARPETLFLGATLKRQL